jgi:mono/diheme cytochrome c family protein
MRRYLLAIGTMGLAPLVIAAALDRQSSEANLPDPVSRGRYLVQIAGCNDCHTPGYMVSAGKVEEKAWLTGEPLGWRGPWGTTYASNLRLLVQGMTADQFMRHARSDQRRPPMPWFNVRDMSDTDVKAIYAYLKHVAGGCRQLQSRKACGLPPRRGAGTSAGVTPSRVEVVCRCAFAT